MDGKFDDDDLPPLPAPILLRQRGEIGTDWDYTWENFFYNKTRQKFTENQMEHFSKLFLADILNPEFKENMKRRNYRQLISYRNLYRTYARKFVNLSRERAKERARESLLDMPTEMIGLILHYMP